LGYVAAYNILFLGFGILVVIGLYILIFLSGSFEKNKESGKLFYGEESMIAA
jgi:hypothetical protein